MGHKQTYKEKQEQVLASMHAAGLVSERFFGVESIVFHLTYYQPAVNPVLMKRTLSFFPAHYAFFHVRCPRTGCTDGGFDLSPMVADLVSSHKRSQKGSILCHGTNEAPGHSRISYEITITYC